MSYYKTLHIPDTHHPWHNKRAWQLMLNIAEDENKIAPFDEIIQHGDMADFYWLSMHDKLPEHFDIECTLFDEIADIKKGWRDIIAINENAKRTWIMGNHEFRLERYIIKKCPEFVDFLKFDDLMCLKDYKIKKVPYGKDQLYSVNGSNLYCRHEPFAGGENCAGGTAKKGHLSIMFGHTHRSQSYTDKDALGREIDCISLGWLGDPKAPVMQYIRGIEKWTYGFTISHVFGPDDYHTEVVRIKYVNGKYRAVRNGFAYET